MRKRNPYKRLTEEISKKVFDCGDADLNDFLLNDALKWQTALLSVTYYLSVQGQIILYFSLSNDKIQANSFEKAEWRRFKSASLIQNTEKIIQQLKSVDLPLIRDSAGLMNIGVQNIGLHKALDD